MVTGHRLHVRRALGDEEAWTVSIRRHYETWLRIFPHVRSAADAQAHLEVAMVA